MKNDNKTNELLLNEISKLRKSEKFFKGLLESFPDGMIIVDDKRKIKMVNNQFTKLFGYTKDKVIGKTIDFLIPTSYSKHQSHFTKYVKNPQTRPMNSGQEMFGIRKDGTKFPVDISLSPMKTTSGLLISSAVRDITKRKKVEDELAKHREHLEELVDERTSELNESNSMKELLLDVIAHDLKNPATVIKGFAQFGIEDDPNSEIFDAIIKGTDNLLNVISNATTLSKVTIGDKIAKEEINLVNIINARISEYSSQLKYEEMTLDMNLKGELIVNANPIIGEVFRNYISNAIKYAKTGKKIIINADKEPGYVVVNVKDFGKTIEKKDRENVFVRNVQLGKTKGRGLGLAIVKRIAIAHDAEVGVKPNKPTGNNFYIKIPVL